MKDFFLILLERSTEPFYSYQQFKKQLITSSNSFQFTTIKCHIKNPLQKNYKPNDPQKQLSAVSVPTYSSKQHLEHYLEQIDLSAAVVLKPMGDGTTFGSFTTGDYFRSLCNQLDNVVPICCMVPL
jgi:hypothetical protein